jgi:hypothetical protein
MVTGICHRPGFVVEPRGAFEISAQELGEERREEDLDSAVVFTTFREVMAATRPESLGWDVPVDLVD